MSAELVGIVLNSVYVSAVPALISAVVGTPAALWLHMRGGRLAAALKALFNGLVGVPTVLLGLLLYLLLARSGPLGGLGILYTLEAVVVGHTLLVLPLYLSYALTALEGVDPRVRELAEMFGLGKATLLKIYLREAAGGLAGAVAASYGRALGELGIALMLGGDIRYKTRVLTTAVAHETMLGNWDVAIQLGVILLVMAVAVSAVVTALGFKYRG
ncbi:binding-protein-dependent transport systems inner membrane component [Pyrobaculum islandicum DSM 4184]|uniref:Binding-protein-dependent transport systems inner membrane component n=1 Tax=Pyrobaculum islandicum (strain DSM 4184 / JCM 9189 / GEO3) TaxID=384616 RepID=A1RQJ9_PYRIL|nr:ABC transporter permease [Pyrobaculum islandicum]ABL87231.1 binding-protein-dependent transport systems inner membrane component [Pyrobaculum islandicum DSM 4184]